MWRMSQLAEELSALQEQLLHGVSEWVRQYMNVVFTCLLCTQKVASLTGIQNVVSLMCWRCFPHVPPIWITSTCTCNGNVAQFQGWLYCSMDQGCLLQSANGTHRSLQWSGHCGWWTWISACRVDTLPLPARPNHKISDTSVHNICIHYTMSNDLLTLLAASHHTLGQHEVIIMVMLKALMCTWPTNKLSPIQILIHLTVWQG